MIIINYINIFLILKIISDNIFIIKEFNNIIYLFFLKKK